MSIAAKIQKQSSLIFTEDQLQAISMVSDLINPTNINNRFIGIYGYAGTGKTTTICKTVKYLIENKLIKKVALVAPTNKAVMVLEDVFESFEDISTNITFMTIHKLFGYQKSNSLDGKVNFVLSNSLPNIRKYDLIIIDECSMIGVSLAIDIFTIINNNPASRFVFLGDPAQLPPVNESSSPFFDISKLTERTYYYELSSKKQKLEFETFQDMMNILKKKTIIMTKVVRNSNNNFTKFVYGIRLWALLSHNVPNFDTAGNSVRCYDNNKQWINTSKKYFINTNKNKNYDRNIILCWTNKSVDKYNKLLRKKILKKIPVDDYVKGDIIIFTRHHKVKGKNAGEISYYTSQQTKVLSVNKYLINYNLSVFKKLSTDGIPLCIINKIKKLTSINFNMNILCVEDDESIFKVVHSSSQKEYTKYKDNIYDKIDNITKMLLSVKNTGYEVFITSLWKIYEKLFNDTFAEINLGFATTCHKSQASTFTNVFIDFSDVLQNKSNDHEMRKCFYTACTRASRTVHIYAS